MKRTDNDYIKLAKEVSLLSTCLRTKIGAVVVKDNKVIGIGFNGTPKGLVSCLERGVCAKAEAGLEYESGDLVCRGIHAEQHALLNCRTKGATLYVTKQPCFTCTKLLIEAGIRQVIWESDWGNNKLSESIRTESGIIWQKLKHDNC